MRRRGRGGEEGGARDKTGGIKRAGCTRDTRESQILRRGILLFTDARPTAAPFAPFWPPALAGTARPRSRSSAFSGGPSSALTWALCDGYSHKTAYSQPRAPRSYRALPA
jgi:hypothetical protein